MQSGLPRCVLTPIQDDGVQGPVELAAAAAESRTERLSARGRDRCAGESREGGVGSDPSWCDQVTISCAVTIGTTLGSSRSCGVSARARPGGNGYAYLSISDWLKTGNDAAGPFKRRC